MTWIFYIYKKKKEQFVLSPVHSVHARFIVLFQSWTIKCFLLSPAKILIKKSIITARKRSLGQGNIFTPVCHSVHRGGHAWLLPGGGAGEGACMVAPGGACVVARGGVHGCSGGGGVCMVAPGGVHGFIWGGMHGFIWGACVVLFGGHAWFYFGGACVVLFGGHAWFYLGGHAWFYSGGVCEVFSVFSDTMRYGQWAGGTHPTGMHSCWKMAIKMNVANQKSILGYSWTWNLHIWIHLNFFRKSKTWLRWYLSHKIQKLQKSNVSTYHCKLPLS